MHRAPGISVTTSEMGVGGRVAHVQPNIGAVATQSYTEPRLGSLALQLLGVWVTRCSAGILVYENEGYAVINLRVDAHDTPMQELWRLFNKLYPLVPYYKARPDHPSIGRVVDWAREHGLSL
jgi:uncharacterized Ntn-hydrolase superfamily protein